jgi:hypothetical protein
MSEEKKQFSEKVQDKALDVAGKVAEEGAKQFLGIGSAISWMIKLGSLGFFLVVLGIIALVVYFIVR